METLAKANEKLKAENAALNENVRKQEKQRKDTEARMTLLMHRLAMHHTNSSIPSFTDRPGSTPKKDSDSEKVKDKDTNAAGKNHNPAASRGRNAAHSPATRIIRGKGSRQQRIRCGVPTGQRHGG